MSTRLYRASRGANVNTFLLPDGSDALLAVPLETIQFLGLNLQDQLLEASSLIRFLP